MRDHRLAHTVIEGDGPRADGHARSAVEAGVETGRRPLHGFTGAGRDAVCQGSVASTADAQLALLAALGGALLVVRASGSRRTIDAFLDDLRRLGPVDHVTPDRPAPRRLDREQRALLGLLSEGLTLGESANQLGLARRTADRRLAAARELLGVRTTAEAIMAAHEAGRGEPTA